MRPVHMRMEFTFELSQQKKYVLMIAYSFSHLIKMSYASKDKNAYLAHASLRMILNNMIINHASSVEKINIGWYT